MSFVNAFIDRAKAPLDAELSDVLGKSFTLWSELCSRAREEFGVANQDWHSYSRKAGWALRLKKGSRTIFYMAPAAGGFRASFALGEKAVDAAKANALPAEVIKAIDEAPRFAEGRAVRIDVVRKSDLAIVMKLVAAKLL